MKQFFVLLVAQLICSVTCLGQVDYTHASNVALIIDPQGDDDKDGFFALSDQYEELQKMHPEHITLLHYPESGHAMHYEQPERFKTDLIHFLQKIR